MGLLHMEDSLILRRECSVTNITENYHSLLSLE
jgi:hypothetical protein